MPWGQRSTATGLYGGETPLKKKGKLDRRKWIIPGHDVLCYFDSQARHGVPGDR